ncbi:peptidoglycan DD-metalloendopeptidase family protein [Microbacterium aoyamense]|nr:peptidoglycan DD-metalloendopeptidase family protein [Microbacterium aoyamense]
MTAPGVELSFPFTGRWMAQNSPADHVPSHGTHLFATTYAIDFVALDERGRTAPRSWRSAFSTEAPEIFLGFGVDLLSPLSGTVVATHDGEEDHIARRSPFALAAYALTQWERVRGGAGAIAGNHVVIKDARRFVLLAHLRRGSLVVRPGDDVVVGTRIGACGNSGNSTEPHVHVQAMDAADATIARGLPITFATPAGHVLPRNGEPFIA